MLSQVILNWLKKMHKNILAIIVIIILASLTYFFITRKPKDLILTTVPESYNSVSLVNESDDIYLKLYINQKNTTLIDTQKIANAYFTDAKLDTIINTQVKDISYYGEVDFDGTPYYCYQFHLVVDTLENIEIDEAYLRINYYHLEDVVIRIGSLSIYKVNAFECDDFRITNLKGIVNVIDNKKTLVGIIIRFENVRDDKITITDVKPLDVNLSCSDYYQVDNRNIKANEDISSILGYEYDINQNSKDINISFTNEISILFPLAYQNHYEIPQCGLVISYTLHGKDKKAYFNEFCYFINHERLIDLDELIFYHYENN